VTVPVAYPSRRVRAGVLLGPDERLLTSAYAVLEDGVTPEAALGPGVLYLTNRRLVFESGTAGRFRRRRPRATLVDARLEEVRNVDVERSRLRAPRLLVELLHGKPRFELHDPGAWATEIAQAKRSVPPSGATVVERTTIERQVVKVRCRFCSALANEVDGRCPSCGAPL
jgi:hypothetical protein